MKKTILAMAAVILASTLASACPGGDLIQFISKGSNKVVIANYNKMTGKREGVSKSLVSLQILLANGTSACTNESCDTLRRMQDEDLTIRYQLMGSSRVRALTIQDVTIDPHQPVAKDGPPMMGQALGTQDAEGNMIFTCSHK